MKLKDFISYKEFCPCCGNKLHLSFLKSKRRQKIKCKNNIIKLTIQLSEAGTWNKKYYTHYFLNTETNEFYISFEYHYGYHSLNSNIDLSKQVPIDLINQFMLFQQNNLSFSIFKECKKCYSYTYNSLDCYLNFKSCTLEKVRIENEILRITKPINNKYKKYVIHNDYKFRKSIVLSKIANDENEIVNINNSTNTIYVPIINLSQDHNNIYSKIDTLMMFS